MIAARFHLAQVNLARFRRPAADPANAPYRLALREVDAAAEGQAGFVWRLREAGQVATSDVFGPDVAANLSVWTDPDSLAGFVYRDPAHRAIMARRREWFAALSLHQALWWVPTGHRPTLAEARDRLDALARLGPTPGAFTFARRFAPPPADGPYCTCSPG